MLIKNLFILLFLSIFTFGHNVVGVDMTVKKISDNQIEVKAFNKRSKNPLSGNEIRLISMFDNRVLTKSKLQSEGTVLDIPKESYWVYIMVRDNDIVRDGIAPTSGFEKTIVKENLAVKYSIVVGLVFILFSFFLAYKRSQRFRQTLI